MSRHSVYRSLAAVLLFVALQTHPWAAQSALAQPERPRPYPVIPDPRFDRAVEAGTRTETGTPGPNYWTNAATYEIEATLSPATATLNGHSRATYINNSPDALKSVYVHLRQNLNAPGVVRNRIQKLASGVRLSEVRAGGEPLIEQRGGPGYTIANTVMQIRLADPIPAGGRREFEFAWSFEIPEAGAPRMGQDGEVFYLGYWYPQFAVYDDVRGWVAEPYMGNGEFYMGYADYEVAITVPEGFLVAATGELLNPEEVLSPQTRSRLDGVRSTEEIVTIVGAEERTAGVSTTSSPVGTLTWRFRAENVRDFAFGASDRYVWDVTLASTGDVDGDGRDDTALIHAFYRPEEPAWSRAAEFGRFSIEFLSDMLLPYPWPHMTVVEGIIGGGMEYPMMTLIGGTGRSERSLFGTTFHEISHMWVPMIVGQDEKAWAWMDEGLTTYNTTEASGEFWEDDSVWDPGRQGYFRIAGSGDEVASMRHSDRYPYGTSARGIASYNKPGLAMRALEWVVGEETFREAYREYVARWAYKHPYPYDLFNTFEDVAGRDLDWFWTSLFFETWTMDHAVGDVAQEDEGVVVTVRDLGLTPMPSPVVVTYADGTTREQRVPVEPWLEGEREARLHFERGTPVRVEIDPEAWLPDVDRSNNVWTAAEEVGARR